MKKLIILGGAACLLVSFPAFARVDIGVNLGVPGPVYYSQPAYIEDPGPAYVVAPAYPDYYHHRHYHRRPEDRGWRH